jgi:ATP-dependent RNA helicase RhlE
MSLLQALPSFWRWPNKNVPLQQTKVLRMTFKDLNLNNPLWNALDDMGVEIPTTIQAASFSTIMSGRDVLGIAQTGTGKTIAYLLPLLKQWVFNKNRHAQFLILVPTRELVVQVVEQAELLAKYSNCVIKGVYGGTNLKVQAADIADGVDIVVGTPGRVLDLGYHGSIQLKLIKKLVIDEMDEMLALGFRSQLEHIFDLLPEKRQNLLFSATITDDVERLLDNYFANPEKVEAAPSGSPVANINQAAYRVPNYNTKINLLKLLLHEAKEMDKVLIFVSTKALADELHGQLLDLYPDTMGLIHSNKDQNYRFNAVNRFKSGEYRFLIATDIISRGIDISDVSHVINFDMPDEAESYVHRIGRTGRFDKKGEAISLISDFDVEIFEMAQLIMDFEVPFMDNPVDLVVSDVLEDFEVPRVAMRNTIAKITKVEAGGGAYHEKKAKNQKINQKVRYTDKMHAKYGKPKTRGQKPKGRKK